MENRPWTTYVRIMLLARFIALVVAGMLQSCNGTSSAAEPAAATAVQLEDLERRVGPFAIGARRFTVVLHEKQVVGDTPPDPDWQTTLAALEIVDDTGAVHYRETFPYRPSGNEFGDSLGVSVSPLEGEHSSGLLVTYGVVPSTPLGGQSWQVFGIFEGRLVPFSKPISLDGDLVHDEGPSQGAVRTTEEPGRRGETLHFRVWTGNFFVVYPVLVDWLRAKVEPAWRCMPSTGNGPRASCPYRIVAERVPQEDELTFVRLHVEADEDMGTPQHVVLKRDSRVDLLGSEGEVRWQEDESSVGLAPGDDFWIKVRIDGREGWIHTQEDFSALGLPQAG
jgi:hypothetical protein